MNILESINENLKDIFDKEVIVTNDESLTYGKLWEMSNRLGTWILDNIKGNKPIVVYGHKSPMMLVAFLACAKSGRAYCPVDISMPNDRVKDIIEQAGNPYIFAIEDFGENSDAVIADFKESFRKSTGEELRLLDKKSLLEISKEHRETNLRGSWLKDDETFYIIFTSGSTGRPKGVEISAASLFNFTSWSRGLGCEEQVFSKTYMNQAPFSFDLSVMDVYTALRTGGRIFCLTKDVQKDMASLYEKLAQGKINFWVSTPSFADMCLADPCFNKELLPELEAFLFCGEKLTKETASKLMQRFEGVKIINTYGPTESTVAVTDIEITKEMLEEENSLPIGRVKPGTEIIISDEGEIVIGGNTLSSGYFNDEEKTAAAFYEKDGKRYYKTGDEGFYIDDVLYYKGRIDLQIKLHGYRIELGDIENNLIEIDDISMACVVPKWKDEKIRHLVAFVCSEKDFSDKSEKREFVKQIKEKLKERLPEYMVPKTFEIVKTLPLTNNGKMDRKAIERMV